MIIGEWIVSKSGKGSGWFPGYGTQPLLGQSPASKSMQDRHKYMVECKCDTMVRVSITRSFLLLVVASAMLELVACSRPSVPLLVSSRGSSSFDQKGQGNCLPVSIDGFHIESIAHISSNEISCVALLRSDTAIATTVKGNLLRYNLSTGSWTS